jgi:hypothetical protein
MSRCRGPKIPSLFILETNVDSLAPAWRQLLAVPLSFLGRAEPGPKFRLRSHAATATLLGIVKLNVAPRPEFPVAQIRPPCDSTMERVMASPKPVP